MTQHLNPLDAKTAGSDPVGYTNYEKLLADIGYLIGQDGSIASANSLPITCGVHVVTGTTTIQNITDAAGLAVGQPLTLIFQSALTIQHLAGGTGNISLRGGDINVEAGAALRFVYTGTVWQLIGPAAGVEIDYQQITAPTASINATTEGTAQAVITGNAKTFDGSRVKLEFFAPRLTGAAAPLVTFVFLRDTTIIGQSANMIGSAGNTRGFGYGVAFDTPAAGSHTYSVKAFVSASSLTVDAGLGGSGALLPAFLRVTKA